MCTVKLHVKQHICCRGVILINSPTTNTVMTDYGILNVKY